jgi:Regulator of chromosome condensation (RCC1) repeat
MQVSAGNHHTLLRSCKGEVYGCGSTDSGQLGPQSNDAASVSVPHCLPLPTNSSGPSAALAVAAGDHSLAICCDAIGSANAPQTCNTPLALPDLLSLARAAQQNAQQPGDDTAARVRALIEALQCIFSCPGVLIAGFSLPPQRRESVELDAPAPLKRRRAPAPHQLDTDAISTVFEAILLALDIDVVVALRSTITSLLQDIELREVAAERDGAGSALAQAQWLKVLCRSIFCMLSCALHPGHPECLLVAQMGRPSAPHVALHTVCICSSLQVLVIFLMNPINSDAHAGAQQLPAALARVTFLLKPQARHLLTTWLAALPADVLGGRVLRPLQRHLSSHVEVCTSYTCNVCKPACKPVNTDMAVARSTCRAAEVVWFVAQEWQ